MEESRNKNHKGFKIFVLLLLIGIIFFMNKDNQVKFINAYRSLTMRDKILEKVQFTELDENVERVGLLGKNTTIWNNSKLSIMDKDSNLILEKQFNFEMPDIIFGDKHSYIMDKATGDIYIINNNGETIERIVLDNKINNLVKDEDHLIAHTKSEEEENIVLLDNEGVLLKVHPIESMSILTYNVDKKGDKYLISNLMIKDMLKSEIYSYAIDGKLLNTSTIDNEIIIFTKFVKDDVIVLTDKCLYYIRDEKIYWKKSFTNIKDVILRDDYVYILYGENLEIINLEGRTIDKLSFTEQLSKICDYDKLILLWGDYDLLGIEGNKKILKYKHNEVIKDIIISKNYLGLVDHSGLHLFEIHNK